MQNSTSKTWLKPGTRQFLLRRQTHADFQLTADNHGFYELNLYSNSIYYISSYPGVARKVSPDGSKDELLINEKVGNLIVYKEHIYYRLSEDNNWGKMYRADLNGQNKKLLSQRVNKFCIYNDKIYYSDIGDLNALCSMNIDGSGISVINKSLTNNILVENNMLIYSDHDRNDNLFTYDLSTNIEKCISKDKCWNLNCNKDFIFYRNQSDSGSLYCLRFDGTEKRKLVEDSVTDILVIDDYLIYRNVTKYDKTEYLDYNSYLSKQFFSSIVYVKRTTLIVVRFFLEKYRKNYKKLLTYVEKYDNMQA